jgi:hypothetical protein
MGASKNHPQILNDHAKRATHLSASHIDNASCRVLAWQMLGENGMTDLGVFITRAIVLTDFISTIAMGIALGSTIEIAIVTFRLFTRLQSAANGQRFKSHTLLRFRLALAGSWLFRQHFVLLFLCKICACAETRAQAP